MDGSRDRHPAKSGVFQFDEIIQYLRMGDNVVWQVDELEEYAYFAEPFAEQALRDGRRLVYMRFAPHLPVLKELPGLVTVTLDPHVGFDAFSAEVHQVISEQGQGVFYVFDNLSALVTEWATDELLANFFRVTCPYLFELDTIAYFALIRGQHAHGAVAQIRDTTQLLIDVYRVRNMMYLHPLKVWERYSPQMFLPRVMSGHTWTPVIYSGEAAEVSGMVKQPLRSREKSIAPWKSVYRKLIQYRECGADVAEGGPEITPLKQELSRMMIGNHPEFNRLVDEYLTIEDLFRIRDRMIGSGRIGGKAAGMLLARSILCSGPAGKTDFLQVLEPHDSFYIGSDVFFTFLVNNELFRTRLHLSRGSPLSCEEFEEVEQRFLEGKFPTAIVEQLQDMLDYFGQAPIIARSSSLLEDSFGNAFAGKYRSEYCVNQDSPEQRLEEFMRAVKLIYASTLNPDALSYRRARGLVESDEQMAILVQRVSGMAYRNYFFPALAGVAFSRNLYAWTDRIDPQKGMIRLVFGLGTRAVNRVGDDYPRMIAISHPQLRPETGMRIAKYSQWDMDLLDLKMNQFVTARIEDILEKRDYPNLHLMISLLSEGFLVDPYLGRLEGSEGSFVVTFNNLINRTDFVRIIGEMLERLEAAYGHPLDTEFTASVNGAGQVRINLLQCRPMRLPGSSGPVTFPEGLPKEKVLFRSTRTISGGVVPDIRWLLYIDPRKYAYIATQETKKTLGRAVGLINKHPEIAHGGIVMMGPGRWGSSNIDLGVNVTYADINNASVLVEIAREEAGHVPEVSYGTHFFLDLVEAKIIYLPVFPGDPGADFNGAFFDAEPNALAGTVPEAAKFAEYISLIDLERGPHARRATVVADPHSQRAVCYLQ